VSAYKKHVLNFSSKGGRFCFAYCLKKSPPAWLKGIPATLAYTERAPALFALFFLLNLLCAAGGKAFTAQHGSSARRLEGHAVGFAALVAGYFETLPLAAPRASAASAEIGATAIAASLATLRLAQIPLRVILLFAFGEWKLRAALGTGDLYVWHFQLLPTESLVRGSKRLSLFRRRAWRSSLGIRFWL
jgi:hypothetical protein